MNCSKQNDFRFEYQKEPLLEDTQILFEGISEEAALKKTMGRIQPFAIFIKDSTGVVLGGVNGFTYYGCLYVDMLWLKEALRNLGFGRKLMEMAEKLGIKDRCTFATVNTMDWEALTFYQKLGYELEFVREGYEKVSKMYMLRKQL